MAAAALAMAVVGLGWTHATEVSRLAEKVATILRIHTPRGVLVLQVDDPAVKVRVDDQAEEIVLNGAGVYEVRLRPGPHILQAHREGKLVYAEILTITRGGRSVAKIGRETGGRPGAAEPRGEPAGTSAPARKTRRGSAATAAALKQELDDVVGEYHRLMKGPLAKDADVFRKLEDRMIDLRRRLRAAEGQAPAAPPRPAAPAPARRDRSGRGGAAPSRGARSGAAERPAAQAGAGGEEAAARSAPDDDAVPESRTRSGGNPSPHPGPFS
jgi:hypothetical protein